MAKREPQQPEILAAGAVVLRPDPDTDGGSQVLVVHRPRYDDWTLPKGKIEDGELLPVTAVREVREETGVAIRLGAPLGVREYPIELSKGKHKQAIKVVHWWVGVRLAECARDQGDEVDDQAWWPVERAAAELTYADEREVLEQALATPRGGTIVLVRHAKAIPRKRFKGKHDAKRGLNTRGRRQAQEVAPVLSAFGVTDLISSSWVRCLDTFVPYAKERGLTIRKVELLTEAGAHGRSKGVRLYLARLRTRVATTPDKTVAVCGHRPVLPDMFSGLSLPDRPMETGECIVVHLAADGSPDAVEIHTSPV